MGTVRMILIVKGRRLQAATIGFFEAIIYIVALGWVVNSLDEPFNILVYALGFAAGNYVGIYLEEKLALGHVCVQVIPSLKSQPIVEQLRKDGYGVTVIEAVGKNGPKNILKCIRRKKKFKKDVKVTGTSGSKSIYCYYGCQKNTRWLLQTSKG